MAYEDVHILDPNPVDDPAIEAVPIFFSFDRSRINAWQKCPRLRYWNYEHQGTGLELVRMAVPLLTGSLVHKPIAEVLSGKPVAPAIAEAQAEYRRLVGERGLVIEEGSEQGNVADEQVAMIEALVLGFAEVLLPKLLNDYEVISVEEELSLDYLPYGGRQLARPDAIFRRKSDGMLVVPDFKTAAALDGFFLKKWRYDSVTLAQILPIEAKLKEKAAGVVIIGLAKGKRLEYPEGSGNRYHNSPLLWAWRRDDEWRARYEWSCTEAHDLGKGKYCPGGKTHKLSGFHKAAIWREYPGGVPAWISYLASCDRPLLEQQFLTLPPIMRSEWEIEEWVRSTLTIEQGIAVAAKLVNEGKAELPELFPKHSSNGNCSYPSPCAFHECCWGSAASDPLGSGLYQIRTFNHPAEAEL